MDDSSCDWPMMIAIGGHRSGIWHLAGMDKEGVGGTWSEMCGGKELAKSGGALDICFAFEAQGLEFGNA